MTYCVAMRLNAGLVFLSDSRTNAGLDQISTFRKMTIYEREGDRVLVLLSAGNLAITQAVKQVLGREAIDGKGQAFDALKGTKGEIDADIKLLNDRFGDTAGVTAPIRTVSATWDPLAKRADEVMGSQQAVLALAGHADSFTGKIPQLQAQLNEVVRGLASGGASSAQVFTALNQVVTSSTMARRIAEDERARQIAREYEERRREAETRQRDGPERDPRAR